MSPASHSIRPPGPQHPHQCSADIMDMYTIYQSEGVSLNGIFCPCPDTPNTSSDTKIQVQAPKKQVQTPKMQVQAPKMQVQTPKALSEFYVNY